MAIEARTILSEASAILAAAGIDSAKGDARLLLGIALGHDRAVLPHETLPYYSDADAARFDDLLARRCGGEPVSRIRGWREFWSLRFGLSAGTLDPRPDSEILVERAIGFAKQSVDLRLLDIGTGSGCLLLACLSELPLATGIGIDASADAIVAATDNARALGLAGRATFANRNFADRVDDLGQFDIILCNPPYIPSGDIDHLAPEVAQYDPRLALDGGDDGLECWRVLMPVMAALLSLQGRAFLEIGDGQAEDVGALASAAGLVSAGIHDDLSGVARCISLQK